ncbi:MAG: hypothetical protein Q9214_006830, partial [Letrouitia sp. 1 TL-2023]
LDENQAKAHVPSIEASKSDVVEPIEDAATSDDGTNLYIKGSKSSKRLRLTSLPVEADTEEASDAESDRTIRPRKVPKRGATI